MEVQLLQAGKSHHRSASIPDLMIAATAELAGLAVLHLDKDFELIAAITAQSVERVWFVSPSDTHFHAQRATIAALPEA